MVCCLFFLFGLLQKTAVCLVSSDYLVALLLLLASLSLGSGCCPGPQKKEKRIIIKKIKSSKFNIGYMRLTSTPSSYIKQNPKVSKNGSGK